MNLYQKQEGDFGEEFYLDHTVQAVWSDGGVFHHLCRYFLNIAQVQNPDLSWPPIWEVHLFKEEDWAALPDERYVIYDSAVVKRRGHTNQVHLLGKHKVLIRLLEEPRISVTSTALYPK